VHGDIGYVSLWTPDAARAAAFYGHVLGWTYDPVSHQVTNTDLPTGIFATDQPATLFCCYAVEDVRAAHGSANLQELVQVWPTPRQPHDHPPRAGDHLRGDFDQPGPPGAGEAFPKGVAVAPLVEELPPRRLGKRPLAIHIKYMGETKRGERFNGFDLPRKVSLCAGSRRRESVSATQAACNPA